MGALNSIFKSKRLLIIQTISMLTFFASALAAWKLLSYTLNTTTPVVVILTGSMLPEYRRGDVLVVDNRFHSLKIADIVVYSIPGRDIPIVHRIHVIHNPGTEDESRFLTKGDNNQVYDQQLYARGQSFLSRTNIYGASVAYAPYFGMFTIWTTDYPWLRYAILGIMGLFIMLGKE
ncbi:uncharacterized protein [Blastocystis hominis]|uniref:Signal peptidase complex catalytic subunit SEC11 n=1 Tax=Blastocystis hominis TaxID=12968 RepID=D8LXD3_BLAHO|nr:uncharacterized protein [Blastocystis hominis]CBK20928.2 unnamed protein product [Blastocystis hominis]|eukprot:XP_012894976.1 uncharacterized protein [Blastocystis hominis]